MRPYILIFCLLANLPGSGWADDTRMRVAGDNAASDQPIGHGADQEQEAPVLDLHEAIRIAKAYNPHLRAARANIEASEGERIDAGLWDNPEFEVQSEEIPLDSVGFSAAKNTVGLAQTFPFPGKKSLDRKAADLGIQQRRNEYEAKELEVIRDVTTAFYRVLASQRSMEILEELSSLSQSLATSAEKRLKAGEAPAQELLRAQIEWQRATTALERSSGELDEARQRLAAIIGRRDLKHAALSEDQSAERDDALFGHQHHDALQHHPLMRQAQLAVREAEAIHDRAKKEPLPDVTVGAAFGSRESESEGRDNLAELSISFPLPLIDRGQGQKRTSKGKLEAALAQLEATEQELIEQLGSATTRFLTAAKRVGAYRDGMLPNVDKALSLMQRGFQEGKFSFIDVLDTQRTAAETRLDYQEALFELNAAEATLDSLLAHHQMEIKEN